ncbi:MULTISPECIES: MerR family transcriptional regulator [unclassified Enterococcus]|uniref:MerR family transcriptional regulator n=1 Tax=unclassified Enterococcus TaxID=2608891 RepID=UPI0013EDB4F0|nr:MULTISPECIES: MerR family transcriptional regulator [unclassified Enterococcus]
MEKMYTIGEVSELLNLPKSTIRYWDEQGLISSSRHEDNGYRLFDIDDIFKLYDIDFYRNLDIPIKQMKDLYGKTLSDLYETLDETEKRIRNEIAVMKKKHQEIDFRKKQLKLMIDTKQNEFPVESIPFDRIISSDFENFMEIKMFLANYSSFGIISTTSSNAETAYGLCIGKAQEHLPVEEAEVIWEKNESAVYRRFLLKVEMNRTENNNIKEVRDLLKTQGVETGQVIGQYLLTNTTKENISYEYYHAWIETKKAADR